MRTIILFLIVSIIITVNNFANGVGVIDASQGVYLELVSSKIDVKVENQVAVIISEQTFMNIQDDSVKFKYAYPMPESASAISLEFFINNQWWKAQIRAEEQDSTLPGTGGGEIDWALQTYLGNIPLYYNINEKLNTNEVVIVRLTYVELLQYKFGDVTFTCPNDYTLIQNTPIEFQQFDFSLNSSRTIENIELLSHDNSTVSNTGYIGNINFTLSNEIPEKDYAVKYTLNSNELGLFSFSTFQPDSAILDEGGKGFFTFVAEPDPSNVSEVINKVFTLIIDRSGSMGGNKIDQAKSAASFIINNLNDGDRFNIVDFSSEVTSFKSTHQLFNSNNRQAALDYISSIYATGGTNISDAFGTAIPQFAAANDSTANIIIFFTDGEATSGITSTNGILDHVRSLTNQNESEITVFTFGIGDYVNEQLLTLLATENNGLAEFLGNDEVEEVITQFYLLIRNPVLLGTQLSFSSQAINEITPKSLPSLYKGQQMIVSGRYTNPENVTLTLSGRTFGKNVEYNYDLNLADSTVSEYQFLPKIWAKQKIEDLMIEYYSYETDSFKADSLKEYITTISVMYGVITQFTSFTDANVTEVEDITKQEENLSDEFILLGNYPNPFNPSTTIKFSVGRDYYDVVLIKIYNAIGQLVKVLAVDVNGKGIYQISWNGLTNDGRMAPSGMYIYTIDFGNTILSSKMILMK
ncbi:MAG: VWA domain-containing protein [Ignavibacteriales bacterium]|nr:VWA domain-containing protein [Ignavibacteriales bacterium]MCB9260730.1 VWA domain-containing protein [Ignavibacteriales bacterium]